MTKQFFITGLPRSRTAWFANLFTWGDSICYHDALCAEEHSLCFPDSLRRLQAMLTSKSEPRGHSCASNLIVWRTLVEWFPEARWVLIGRDFDCVFKSCMRVEPETDPKILKKMIDEMRGVIDELNPKFVPFDAIDPIKCYGIAEYLGIDIGPATRVRQLCDMNIQIHPPILKRRLAQLKSQLVVDSKEAA